MTAIIYLTVFIGVLYSTLIISYVIGFNSLNEYLLKFKLKKNKVDILISVIVSVRNEENSIIKLINNLKKQTLNNSCYEVIIINDSSTDRTEYIIGEEIKKTEHFSFYNLSEGKKGKKEAIFFGISQSKGELIVTTDADCIHKEKWLETIYDFYLEFKPKMIIGPVLMKGKSFFEKLQSLEFLSLASSTAGAVKIGFPTMCNGANLAYEKETLEEIMNPFSNKYQSGDDIFLLHNLKKKYRKGIMYLKSKSAIVETEAVKGFRSFLKQRIRWTSKSKAYKDFDTIISAVLVLFVNLTLTSLLIFSLVDVVFLKLYLILLAIKFIPDFILLFISSKFYKLRKDLKYLPFLLIIYPIYISTISVIGLFTQKVKWKGRKLK